MCSFVPKTFSGSYGKIWIVIVKAKLVTPGAAICLCLTHVDLPPACMHPSTT